MPSAKVPVPVPLIVSVTPIFWAPPASVALEVAAIASVALSLSLIVVTFAVLPSDLATVEPPRLPSAKFTVSLPSSSVSSNVVNVVLRVAPDTAPASNVTPCVTKVL